MPLLAVAEGGRSWGWTSPVAWACYLIGVGGLAWFVLVESAMGDRALLPLRIFRNRAFGFGVLISVIVGFVMFGAVTLVPSTSRW